MCGMGVAFRGKNNRTYACGLDSLLPGLYRDTPWPYLWGGCKVVVAPKNFLKSIQFFLEFPQNIIQDKFCFPLREMY